jgi:hypothetical protein
MVRATNTPEESGSQLKIVTPATLCTSLPSDEKSSALGSKSVLVTGGGSIAAIQRPSGEATAPPGTDASARAGSAGVEAVAGIGEADDDAETAGDPVGGDVGAAVGGVAQADAMMPSANVAATFT